MPVLRLGAWRKLKMGWVYGQVLDLPIRWNDLDAEL